MMCFVLLSMKNMQLYANMLCNDSAAIEAIMIDTHNCCSHVFSNNNISCSHDHTHFVEHWAVVLIIGIFVPVELNEVLERQEFPTDWVFMMLLHIRYDVDNVKAGAILCANLYSFQRDFFLLESLLLESLLLSEPKLLSK